MTKAGLNSLGEVWRRLLYGVRPPVMSVVEPACGSPNDYHFPHSFGIAALVDYAGFDLCETNISNAPEMFPETCFTVGNVLGIDAGTGAFDYAIIHDLFEHLSLAGLQAAVAEVYRVARKGLCIGFFNMFDGPDLIVRRVHEYHRNRLSARRVRAAFARHASAVEVIHIHTFLRQRFGFDETHNRNAYTLVVRS